MLRGVNRADDETDDEVLAELMREGENRLASEQRARQDRRVRESRWRKFMAAVMFLSQVFVELGRRGLQCLQRSVPRYVAFVDRWLVQSIRVSVHPRKKMSTLRLLLALGLAFALPYIVLTIGRMRFPSGRGAKVSADELDEEKIRSHIIVDRVDTPMPGRRQMFLREGGDGLKLDSTELRCENTVQGVRLLTDSMGYVCTRSQLDKVKAGCCNETDASLPRIKQFTCDQCDTNPPHCCDVFEHCVSCCMHPLNVRFTGIRRDYLTHADPNHPVYSDPAEITVFQYCQYRCRTSSASVQHQNSYRSHRSFCYGIHRPLKVLPTVNSDGFHDEWSGASREGARDHLVPAAQLELDPFYREYAATAAGAD
ncbi:hypothetical protein PHYSODRAFT_549244 [Phytophthora sojae]|uniref:SREBP regulating gene protein n=1 Tax=Phytophthora sojae (strain P6497) TaxID=1094619 RepID=G5A2K8_PHYSP|nr:hypothetical protein PHYSODRAFT_549244 [Phytophthora sojae]EGZ09898.1 hypothetical protein PHYSODRAFT_549244 [Phytophthora sojae]|eukprot:XP_009534759.1 hypothetical protein PHYSODRAFT_549244 [Phytophthora sojae]